MKEEQREIGMQYKFFCCILNLGKNIKFLMLARRLSLRFSRDSLNSPWHFKLNSIAGSRQEEKNLHSFDCNEIFRDEEKSWVFEENLFFAQAAVKETEKSKHSILNKRQTSCIQSSVWIEHVESLDCDSEQSKISTKSAPHFTTSDWLLGKDIFRINHQLRRRVLTDESLKA